MANLNEDSVWIDGIYQLEEDDVVQGGPAGIDNLQAKQLGARTRYLKGQVEQLASDALMAAAKASQAQAQAGTDDIKYMTPLRVAQAIAALASIASASETVSGKVELATVAETITGVDVARATHPAGVKAAITSAISALVNASPQALDTLNELATALGNDPNFATTITNALARKLEIMDYQKAAAIVSVAYGSADSIIGSYTPGITALTNGMMLYVRSASDNATTTPTFTPASGIISAKTIVKGAGAALAAGDIAGSGHWIELQYDATLDKWVLLNPATGVSAAPFRNFAVVTASGNFTVPAGITLLDVELWGGGGGGGGSGSGGGTSGGGGGGGYARGIVTVTPGQVITCTIGAAGTGGGAGAAGSGGGTTSFGAFMSATGGGGGQPNPSGNGGSGGAGSGGTISITSSSGTTGAASNVQGGCGGGASMGGAGGGGAQGFAGAGSVPGGGGGGGGSSSTGGAGARGQINIRY